MKPGSYLLPGVNIAGLSAITSSLQILQDGQGNVLPLQISTTLMAFTGTTLYVGATSGAFTNTKGHFSATVNSYSQVNSINLSGGTSASADWVATADTGTDSINYIDLGINSSVYNDGSYTIGGALTGYLYTNGGDLTIGTQTAAKIIKFHTGGTLTANLRITVADTTLTLAGLGTTNTFSSQTANTVLNGYTFINNTAATNGNQQYAPYILQQGQGFGTTGSVNQSIGFRQEVLPVQGTTAPTGMWKINSSINGAAFGNPFVILTTGSIGVGLTTPSSTTGMLRFIHIQASNDCGIILDNQVTNGRKFELFSTVISAGGAIALYDVQGSAYRLTMSSIGNFLFGGGFANGTAKIHIGAGTATASTAPLKFTIGTVLTTGEAGAMEYSTINSVPQLTLVRSGTTRETIMMGNVVTGSFLTINSTKAISIVASDGNTYNVPFVA